MLKTSGPALLGRLPRGLGLEHGVQDRQQFTHAHGQRHLGRFTRRPQPLVKRLDHRIEPAGGDGRHVQRRPDGSTATKDAPVAATLAGIAIEGADPD